ncbi:MBL fold metallo-hydrolase [Mycobacterium aquaticum]|uniref:MBL fold metallo-hydrolase n=1 Tax=Mycobacterium aquaticum TaxID=1927124 RepID=A0A1X0BCZ0_9MYCO|nr:MBL fold metallo-hydrolase [Mycobacterium aquaticum]ORA39948.1 MBL fold metallo-hydrolase [Mycobacterium aquaticum]
MKFIQYYLDCLSHASYLIGDETTGRAVVVDPQRDVAEYLADAEEEGLRIELVIETHFHADFVSGHLELAEAAGATIVYSSVAAPEFDFMGVEDGQRISLGDVTLEFRHTPGHTPESMSIVVYERPGTAPYGVLTGDTLFIGDVGRPDLLASIGYTAEELAESLYASLHEQLMPLPDDTRVYPAHGAGSACGKNLSTDLWSTIGDQKRTNYALRAPDKQTFIDLVTEGQLPAPGYFVYDAILNRKDRALLDETQLPPAMDYRQASDAVARGAMLIDGRSPEEFAQGHLRGAINIGLAGRYAEFAGSVVRPDTDIVLVTAPGQELEGKNRLARIGFDRVMGYLADPERTMFEHRDDVRIASRLTAVDFGQRAAAIEGLQIVDVRNPGEAAAGMIPGAVNIPVRQLPDRVGELDANAPTVVYCAGGYRSSVAASLLRQRGFADVSDIVGGYTAWTNATQNA